MKKSFLLVVLVILGCASNSATGPEIDTAAKESLSCVCNIDNLGDGQYPALLGKVRSADSNYVEIEILEDPEWNPYSRSDVATLEIGVGYIVGGNWHKQPPCGEGIELDVGDMVVAYYLRGKQDDSKCPEYEDCTTKQCTDEQSFDICTDECEFKTTEDCSKREQEAWLSGTLHIASISNDKVIFGNNKTGTMTIEKSKLGIIHNDIECSYLFPSNKESDSRQLPDEAPLDPEL